MPGFGVMSRLAGAFVLCAISACSSFSKKCVDGICEVREEGQVRYEGDPQRIQQMKSAENQQRTEALHRMERLAKKRDKPAGEPLKVLILRPISRENSLYDLRLDYYNSLKQAYQSLEGIEVLDEQVILQQLADYKAPNPFFSSPWTVKTSHLSGFENNAQPDPNARWKDSVNKIKLDQEFLTWLRIWKVPADVVVHTELFNEKQTGMLKGAKKAHIAQKDLVRYVTSITSAYSLKVKTFEQLGDTSTSLSVIGGRDGKLAGGSLELGNRSAAGDHRAFANLVKKAQPVLRSLLSSSPSESFRVQLEGQTIRQPTSQSTKEVNFGSPKDAKKSLKELFRQ